MGPEFRGAAIDARKGAALHYCGHGGSAADNDRRRQRNEGEAQLGKDGPCLPAAACLASCVGPAGNAEHFIVATQDRILRAALGETPAGATIFLTATGAQFEPPTGAQKRACAALGAADRGALPGERAPAKGCGGEALEEVARAARRAWAKDTAVAFRRNRAKGPNPLSMKKKKKTGKEDKAKTGKEEKVKAPPAKEESKTKEKSKKMPEDEKKGEQQQQKESKTRKESKTKVRLRPRRKKRTEEGGEGTAAAAAAAAAPAAN